MRADPIGLFELIRIQFSPNQIQPDLKLNPSSDWIRSIWIRSCPIPTPLAHNRLQACQVLIGGTELCDSPLSLTRFLSLIFIHLKILHTWKGTTTLQQLHFIVLCIVSHPFLEEILMSRPRIWILYKRRYQKFARKNRINQHPPIHPLLRTNENF